MHSPKCRTKVSDLGLNMIPMLNLRGLGDLQSPGAKSVSTEPVNKQTAAGSCLHEKIAKINHLIAAMQEGLAENANSQRILSSSLSDMDSLVQLASFWHILALKDLDTYKSF